jgi:hypothetical protein
MFIPASIRWSNSLMASLAFLFIRPDCPAGTGTAAPESIAPEAASAARETAGPPVSVTASFSVASQYLAFGSGIQLSSHPVMQGGLFFSHLSGAYVSLWGSAGFDGDYGRRDGQLDFGDELDLGIGWAGSIRGLSVNLSTTYFNEPLPDVLGAFDIIYTHLRIGKTWGNKLTLTGVWQNYSPLHGSPYGGGNLIGLELSRPFQLTRSLTLPVMAGIVHDDGGIDDGKGILLRGSAVLSWKVSKALTVESGYRYYIPTMSDFRSTDGVWWTGMSWNF